MYYTVPGIVGTWPRSRFAYLDERIVKAHPGGVNALSRLWYENDKHNIEPAFL
jgi:hypothetical protein